MKLSDIKVITEQAGHRACKKFRSDTGECKTGCPAKKVKKGNACPYEVEDQHKCPCYA